MVDMDQRKKLVAFLILEELRQQKLCICTMLFVMMCTLAQGYILRKNSRTEKRARIQTNMNDEQATSGTGNEISTDENGIPKVLSPVLENQTSAAAQNANQSQTCRRKKKRKRLPQCHDLSTGFCEIAQSFKLMMENSDKHMEKLVECVTNNHEED